MPQMGTRRPKKKKKRMKPDSSRRSSKRNRKMNCFRSYNRFDIKLRDKWVALNRKKNSFAYGTSLIYCYQFFAPHPSLKSLFFLPSSDLIMSNYARRAGFHLKYLFGGFFVYSSDPTTTLIGRSGVVVKM